jgi:hypothetical protein
MNLSVRRLLAGAALAAVLVPGIPSRAEAAPARDRAPSLRSVSSWSPLAAAGEAWNAFWGWVAQAAEGESPPGDGSASSGGTPVPPDPKDKSDKGSGIDPDGNP